MARGTTLVKLLDDLRVQARLSLNPAHNRNDRPYQVRLLQREQERLWEEHDWPHLRVSRDIPLQAGQRLYSPHPDIPFDRIEKIELFSDGAWFTLSPGIDAHHQTAWNSDRGERSWPPRRWGIHESEQIELWPISDVDGDPETLEGMLRITGIRRLRPLVDDGHVADLDDQIIVGFVAAEMLAEAGNKKAKFVLDKATARRSRLTGNLKPRRVIRMFGIGEPPAPRKFAITQYRRPE